MNNTSVNIILNVVLGMIMFGLGLSLTIKDFKKLFSEPRALAIGLFSQMILLPMVAFLLARYSGLSAELQIGIMILSFCPGGITSNLISYFVKGNVALAISLTVCNALFSLFTIPLLVNISLKYFMDKSQIIVLPFWNTMFEIFIVTILPALAGILVSTIKEGFAKKTEKILNIILPVLLLMVFGFKFLASTDSGGANISKSDILNLAPVVIILNVGSMILGFIMGSFSKLNVKNRITISVEVGLHNTALALLIAGEKLQNHVMEKPALVYALFSFIITFVVAWLLMKFFDKSKEVI